MNQPRETIPESRALPVLVREKAPRPMKSHYIHKGNQRTTKGVSRDKEKVTSKDFNRKTKYEEKCDRYDETTWPESGNLSIHQKDR